MQTDGRNEAVYQIAGENYEKLLKFCEALDDEGYWDEPSLCLNRTIIEMLDLYVQSVLVHFADYANRLNEAERQFILNITENTMISLDMDREVPDSVIAGAKRVSTSPPILLQLCGLRDKEKSTKISGQFIDAFINIILSLSHINHGLRYKDIVAKEFIIEYFDRIQYFLDEAQKLMINRGYIERKTDKDKIENEFTFNIMAKKSKDGIEIIPGGAVMTINNLKEDATFPNQGLSGAKDASGKDEAYEEDEGFEWEDTNVDFSIFENPLVEEILNTAIEKGTLESTHKGEQEKAVQTVSMDTGAAAEADGAVNEEEDAAKKTEEKPEMEEYIEIKDNPEIKDNSETKDDSETNTAAMQDTSEDISIEELKKQQKESFLNHTLKDEQIKAIREEIKAIKEKKSKEKVDSYLNELNQMVGLSQVKEDVRSLINLIRMRKLRITYQMPNMEMSYHMVFTGNPGTGKTTVARLIAKIYKELGVVSKGTLVETDRAGLVAGYVGQTALKVTEVVNKAIGGILFIDEAYSLTNSSVPNDFGTEAIDTLVKLMEDNRNDLVVIVAGYKDEMKEFLSSNPGLISRFNKFIEFPDYELDELIDILKVMAQNAGVEFEENAIEAVRESLGEFTKEELKLFGNARGIRNTFEKIIQNQANRVMAMENPEKEALLAILEEDVKKVLKSMEI